MKVMSTSKNEFLLIFIGTLVLAIGINWFLAPIGLVTGGVSGLAIIVEKVSKNLVGKPIPLWLTTIVCNVPLFAMGIKQRGLGFVKKSIWGVAMLTFALWYTTFISGVFDFAEDILLCSLFGGALVGVGLGLVLKAGATTGGTDMLASVLKYKFPEFSIARLMLWIDAMIIIGGSFIFGVNTAMYAVISVFVTSKVIANVLEGMHYAKAAFIISDQSEQISKEIMEKIPRGATSLAAKGMYSKEEKEMLFVVVSQKEITKLRKIIAEIDEKAFVTIADVREVLGQGFIEDYNSLAL
jgi:uncharacterized membrane-anchored protein YitT (DUF2179 family)